MVGTEDFFAELMQCQKIEMLRYKLIGVVQLHFDEVMHLYSPTFHEDAEWPF